MYKASGFKGVLRLCTCMYRVSVCAQKEEEIEKEKSKMSKRWDPRRISTSTIL